jgi:hypothetical protein
MIESSVNSDTFILNVPAFFKINHLVYFFTPASCNLIDHHHHSGNVTALL